jgi:hypothetical protein
MYNINPIATIITPSTLLFKNSRLYVAQKVLKIDISSLPSIHLRATANIATVAGKNPKMIRPRSENEIHNKFKNANLDIHSSNLLKLPKNPEVSICKPP